MDVLRGGSSVPPGPNEFSFRVKKDGILDLGFDFDPNIRFWLNPARKLW